MAMPFGGFHYNFVDIDLQISPYMMGKYGVHEWLVDDLSILEAEGHVIIIVIAMV